MTDIPTPSVPKATAPKPNANHSKWILYGGIAIGMLLLLRSGILSGLLGGLGGATGSGATGSTSTDGTPTTTGTGTGTGSTGGGDTGTPTGSGNGDGGTPPPTTTGLPGQPGIPSIPGRPHSTLPGHPDFHPGTYPGEHKGHTADHTKKGSHTTHQTVVHGRHTKPHVTYAHQPDKKGLTKGKKGTGTTIKPGAGHASVSDKQKQWGFKGSDGINGGTKQTGRPPRPVVVRPKIPTPKPKPPVPAPPKPPVIRVPEVRPPTPKPPVKAPPGKPVFNRN